MKPWKTVAVIGLSTGLMFGCSQPQDAPEIKKVSMTKQEQQEFVKKIVSLATTKVEEPNLLVEQINDHIAGLDEKEASDSIDALLYSMYQYKDEMNVVAQGLQKSFEKYEEKEVDFNKKDELDKVDDNVLKAFLEQTQNRLLLIGKENEQFVVHADFKKILTMYEEYMAEDLKAMIQFSQEEYEKPYYDHANQKLKYDVVAERIVFMENLAKKHKGSYYESWMNQSKDFYYQHYFGMEGLSISDGSQNLLPDVKVYFENHMKKYNNTKFSQDLELFFKEYQKNKSKVNDNVYVFLLELTNKEHQSVTDNGETSDVELDSANAEGENDSQLKDAIQQAIDQNK